MQLICGLAHPGSEPFKHTSYSLCYSVNHRVVTLIIMQEQRALHHVTNSMLNPFYHWYSTFRIWILNNSVSQPTTELLHWAQWLCIMQQNSLLDCKTCTCLFWNSWYSTGVSQSTTKLCCTMVLCMMEVTNENIFEHAPFLVWKKVVKLQVKLNSWKNFAIQTWWEQRCL